MNLPVISFVKITNILTGSKVTVLLAPVLSILASALVLALVVWPRATQVIKLRNENKQLLSRVTSLEVKATKLASLDTDSLKQDLASAELLLPSDKAVFPLVASIEKAVAGSGVLLNRVEVISPGKANTGASPKEGEIQAGAVKVELKVSLTSDYRSLVQFLTNLLALPRVVAVSELVVNSSSAGGGQVKTSLTVDAYWQALPSELPTIEAPIIDLTASEQSGLAKITTSGSSATTLPVVPKGRSDLFAPF